MCNTCIETFLAPFICLYKICLTFLRTFLLYHISSHLLRLQIDQIIVKLVLVRFLGILSRKFSAFPPDLASSISEPSLTSWILLATAAHLPVSSLFQSARPSVLVCDESVLPSLDEIVSCPFHRVAPALKNNTKISQFTPVSQQHLEFRLRLVWFFQHSTYLGQLTTCRQRGALVAICNKSFRERK